ncbi:hypothetical protein HDE68_003309 [Pedobacter cryoconitis]|uniref:YD repeat-containing protein n=1 Tax=Pedobacter cryoconitis TaxID=188932 RepID=A0A7W8ZNP2_9SPHI|nr:hypothetical protein [Pedobacter cryoconitis]MBB5637394.1 hypothetical protein [Pedobacter cryoconitis]
MNVYKNLFLMLVIVFAGCKKGGESTEDPGGIVPPVVETDKKILIPVQLGTGNSKTVMSYTEGAAFSKIEYGDGTSIGFTYNNTGKPLGLERFKNGELVSLTDYELDENGRVIIGRMAIRKGNNYVLNGHYELKYNELNQVATISFMDINEQLLGKVERRYDQTGNLIGERSTKVDLTYSYDLKNGLFKHVNYAWLLTIEENKNLFLSGINNVKEITDALNSGNTQSFSHVYNKDGYPETVNTVIGGTKTAVKVSYKEIGVN